MDFVNSTSQDASGLNSIIYRTFDALGFGGTLQADRKDFEEKKRSEKCYK
jgi:hypothetical protein